MVKQMNPDSSIREDQIAQRAYELWERDGRPDGKATDHWLQAEAMLRSSQPAGAPARTSETPKTSRPPSAKPASRKREKSFSMVS
jgi:hypothetical protein